MNLKKLLLNLLLIAVISPAFAANTVTADPKYCTMLKQLAPGMNIGDVFLLLGPPHTFGQPPNLNMNAVKNASQAPQKPLNDAPNSSDATNSAEAKERILKSMAQDPILGAFMNAPPDAKNVLIWQFEQNTLNVAIKVKGPTVTDVKANFSCK